MSWLSEGSQGEALRGRLVPGAWAPDPGAQMRAERRGGRYLAFVPDSIAQIELALPGELATDLERGTLEITHLNGEQRESLSLEGVARQLLRSESLASSRIEGLSLGHRRVALAVFDDRAMDSKAADIVGNVRAMEQAIGFAARQPIEPDTLLAVHRTLLRFGEDEPIAGRWRDAQGWIGGSNLRSAVYIPPPPAEVVELVDDLCAFLRREDMPTLCQAAIAHAQFESIHPFVDGNGRVGRCLIHAVLRRRGLTPHYVPPISLILAARRNHYFAGLEEYRRGDGPYHWIAFFAGVCEAAALEAERLSAQIDALRGGWTERLPASMRSDATARRIVALLPAHPVLDVSVVMGQLGVSDRAASLALGQLQDTGIVRLVTKRLRGRVWECPELFALVQEFERGLDGA
jgi:Fic family protein